MEYWLLGGTLELCDRRGGNGGNLTVISFEWGEQLEKITVSCDLENQSTLIQLTLTTRQTRRGGGREVNYGPFGSYYPRRTFIYGNVYGFTGRANKGQIYGLGVYSDRNSRENQWSHADSTSHEEI